MNSTPLLRNRPVVVLLYIAICLLYSSKQRPIIYASAQTCSANDETCTSQCQVATHDNCSEKEIVYINTMESKSSEERRKQIDRLKGFLSRDDENINTDLFPWIKARLHILYHLEGIDPTSDDTIIDTPNDNDTNSEESSESVEKLEQHHKGLVSIEELSQHTTAESTWLSILGKVYDVTTGQAFYGPDAGSYRFYAGRDASPCFSSGQNNEEGAAEPLEEWDGKKLMAILDWSEFYEKHETYQYLGVLAGSKYFDEEGNETEVRKIIMEKAGEAKVQAEKEKEAKKKARLEKKKKLQEERELKKKSNSK